MSIINQTPTLDKPFTEALRLAALGWKVFPAHAPLFNHPQGYHCTCEGWRRTDRCYYSKWRYLYLEPGQHCTKPGKHSVGVESWLSDATNDPHKVGAWAANRPAANYGIACGLSGLLVLDFDTSKPEFAGGELLTWLNAKHPTVMAATGSGGRHLYYATPAGLQLGNETGNLPAGVDVRGAGGYVVGPGSLHASGRRYEWLVVPGDGCMPAPLPGEVLELLRPAAPPRPAPVTRPATLPSDQDLVRLGRRIYGAEFARLFDHGDLTGLRGDRSASAGDFALLKMAAFLTARDPAAMRRLFEQSALYRPEERERRHPGYAAAGGWLDQQIDQAIRVTPRTYDPNYGRDPAAVAAAQGVVL